MIVAGGRSRRAGAPGGAEEATGRMMGAAYWALAKLRGQARRRGAVRRRPGPRRGTRSIEEGGGGGCDREWTLALAAAKLGGKRRVTKKDKRE